MGITDPDPIGGGPLPCGWDIGGNCGCDIRCRDDIGTTGISFLFDAICWTGIVMEYGTTLDCDLCV